VVHHARKGAAHARAGQALRGSSEFHAWGDSNLYLRRVGDQLTLTVEQRAAASVAGIPLALAGDGEALALRVIDAHPSRSAARPLPSAEERVAQALADANAPLTLTELRRPRRLRPATLLAIPSHPVREGRGRRPPPGVPPPRPGALPPPPSPRAL